MTKDELVEYYSSPHWGAISLFQMIRDLGAAGVFPLGYGRGVHLDYVRKERAIRGGYEDVDHLVLVTNMQAIREKAEVKAKAFCVYSYDWNMRELLTFHRNEQWEFLIRNAWLALDYVAAAREWIAELKINGNPFADLKELSK